MQRTKLASIDTILVSPHPAGEGSGRVDAGVQMRRNVRAHAYCPRHNEPFCVLLASPCTLWQPVQPQAATLQLAMAARAAAGRDAAACFALAVLLSAVRASDTAENDGSKLVNVARTRCQRSLPDRGCYPACMR